MLEIEVDHCHHVTVDLYQNQFVTRWQALFEKTASVCSINQVESFAAIITESQAQQRLLEAIDNINNFLRKKFISIPEVCDWNDQNLYNYLHSKFEQLSGTFEHPTRLFALAPSTFREAVRALNFYVHRLEMRPYVEVKPWYISFDKSCYKRLPLEPQDYKLFELEMKPGQAFIHYAELGKTLVDLYKDNLPIEYHGLKNQHFYSAEISIHMFNRPLSLVPLGFQQWAKTNNIDPNDKNLGIGAIPIGQVADIDNARRIVYNGNKITNLRIT